MSILGTRVVRAEDPRLLTAGGTYTDDLRLPELAGAARVTFVRSPVALSAVVDAVAHLGVRHIDMPATRLRMPGASGSAVRDAEPEGAA